MPRIAPWFLLLLATLTSAAPACAPADEAPAPAVAPKPVETALRPFEDLPPVESGKRRGGSGAPAPFSGELEEAVVWKRALAFAAEAEEHFVAAQEAHKVSDRAALNERGREARLLFDRMLEDTAVFEEEIIAAHGEDDAAVQRIVRTRSTWFDRTRWLHKSISR